jgi:hypothetical protein
MYSITVPNDIHLRNLINKDDKGFTQSFGDFGKQLLHDKKFGESVANLRSAHTLLNLFESCTAGSEMIVHPNDFTLLKGVVEAPSGGFQNPGIAMQILPFIDAILDAKKVEK